jgi:hypothetical protein
LDSHTKVFEDPATLPPSRAFDHKTPLLPGAPPVNVKPYKYNPMQKAEIEQQVKKMLKQAVIQLSSSSYASPVLLVKKKDGA